MPSFDFKNISITSVEVISPKIDFKNQTFNYTQTITVSEPSISFINETRVITENITISKPKVETFNQTVTFEEIKIQQVI